MPLRSDWSSQVCSIARGIDAVGDPWTLLILRELLCGERRFDGFRDGLGIAENTLAARLKAMTEAGLVTRHPYFDGRRTRQEYHPTQAARDALPILHAFSLWAEQHASEKEDGRVVIVCRSCDGTSSTGERCSECGQPLTTASTAWITPSDPDRNVLPLAG